MLQFNSPYASLENHSRIINSTPNASIQIPTTKYKLKNIALPQFKMEYHIFCKNCKNYSVTAKNGFQIKCDLCSVPIGTSVSEFFIYIPLEQQLRKMITENFEEICFENSSQDNNFISDVHDCIQYKKLSQKYAGNQTKIISFVVSTDGVALYKSSKESLWAIQLYLNSLKPTRRYLPNSIIVVAIHVGNKKPNMKNLFFPLMTEIERINCAGGIIFTKHNQVIHFLPKITHCCCDLPAKAEVQAMAGHAGHYACGFCLHPGVSIKETPKSRSYIRYVDRGETEELRTHENMLDIYKKWNPSSSTKAIRGINELSCMVGAADFDLINGYAIDYMHCILLGIMGKLFSLWLDSSNHKKPHYIIPKHQKILNDRLMAIKPTSAISRKPRPLNDRASYKANEFRSLLLYYLTFSLSGLLKKCYIDHFRLLSAATYILLKQRISEEEVDEAEEMLTNFSNQFQTL